MKENINNHTSLLLAVALLFSACKKDYGDLNSPTIQQFSSNETQAGLNNLVSDVKSAMRNNLALYLDDVGSIGRETCRFSA